MKTYALYGLMEYLAHIPVGGTSVEVHFTGGQLSGFGIRPATYSTDDPVMQRLIERSELYKSKRIRAL
ncbi:MAG: hypothetical protein K2F87_03125 [Muribaculaceae bacterium]|nr:hypothetical protein [Muribaculaceae bacterium]